MNWFFNQSISQFLIIVIMQLGIFSISLSQGITLFHLHMSICVTKRIGFSLLMQFRGDSSRRWIFSSWTTVSY